MRSSVGGLGRARSMGLVAAGLVAGGVLAGTIGASAASSGGSGTPSATAPTYAAPGMPGHGHGGPPPGAMGASPARGDEKQVTGSTAATLTSKAEARVSGATAFRVETDAGDGYYEVHMQKSDGSMVTVKFDRNLAVTAVEDGMGKGDPAPAGGTAPGTSGGTVG